MTATILQFKKPTPSGAEPWLPSLWDMCQVLKENYHKLDEADRFWFSQIGLARAQGCDAKIETIITCRAIAWSMLGRYRLTVEV